MKECTYLTCNRPSDSWENAKTSELEKMAKGRGWGKRAKDPPTFSLLLSSTFVFLPSPFRATVHRFTVHYAWNRLVHSRPESFFQCRCKWSKDVHLGAFDILKAYSDSRCNNTCFSMCKTPLFSIFRFAVEASFWRFVFDDGVSSSIETS